MAGPNREFSSNLSQRLAVVVRLRKERERAFKTEERSWFGCMDDERN
jgi:hypothetical protein